MAEEAKVAEAPAGEQSEGPVVVVVNKPEDWPEATAVKATEELETLSGAMLFEIRALSFGEDAEVEAAIRRPAPLPESASVAEQAVFAEQTREAWLSRLVAVVDRCWQPLPGNTLAEKVKWAAENFHRNGELERLSDLILNLSGMEGGLAETTNLPAVKVKADPASWAKQSLVKTNYLLSRGGVTLAFPMAGLSQLEQNQILSSVRPPEPPEKPIKHKLTGRVERMEPDLNDATYKQALAAVTAHRKTLQLEAALPFEFPGATLEEKHAWLAKRPVYEVLTLLGHLYHNLTGYRERKNFF